MKLFHYVIMSTIGVTTPCCDDNDYDDDDDVVMSLV